MTIGVDYGERHCRMAALAPGTGIVRSQGRAMLLMTWDAPATLSHPC
jgi:hypothetical protein